MLSKTLGLHIDNIIDNNITVIIPVWNRPLLVLRALRSILAQSLQAKEILIIDDGSSDNTIDEIEKFRAKTKTENLIHIEYLDHCGMPGRLRNIGIKKAKNEWLAFLDSDDEWLPYKLEKQIESLKKNQRLWCHARERWIRGTKIISQNSQKHKREGYIFEYALKKCIIGPSSVIIHKTLFEKHGYFREDLEIAEDYELALRFCAHEHIAYIEKEMLIKYANHGSEQLSTKYDHIENFRIRALEDLISRGFFIDSKKQELAEKELRNKKLIWNRGRIKRESQISSLISLGE